jgi:hypothetical protein
MTWAPDVATELGALGAIYGRDASLARPSGHAALVSGAGSSSNSTAGSDSGSGSVGTDGESGSAATALGLARAANVSAWAPVVPRGLFPALLEQGGMHGDYMGEEDLGEEEEDGTELDPESVPGVGGDLESVDGATEWVHLVVQLLPEPGEAPSENHCGVRLHFSLPNDYLVEPTAVPRVQLAPVVGGGDEGGDGDKRRRGGEKPAQETEEKHSMVGTFGLDGVAVNQILADVESSLAGDCEALCPGIYNACSAVKEILDANNISPERKRSMQIEREEKARMDKRLAGTEVTAESFVAWSQKWYADHPADDPMLDDLHISDGKATGRQLFERGIALAEGTDGEAEGGSAGPDVAPSDAKSAAPAQPVDWDLFDDADLDGLDDLEDDA